MPSVDTPTHSLPPPALHPPHDHGHSHAHGAPPGVFRFPLTLLSSGLGYRLGAAAVLVALLWAVVLWALA